MSKEGELATKVYKPSWFKFAKMLIAFVIIGAVCMFSALNDLNTPDESFPIWAIGILTVVSIVSLLYLWEAINGRPNLRLSPEGIAFNFMRQNKLHTWDDVGPFSISVQHVQFMKIVSLNAYSKNTHRTINQEEDGDNKYMASNADAEIQFLLSDLKIDRSEEGLSELEDEINRWREIHSKSNDIHVHYSEEQVQEVMARLQKKRRYWTVFFIGIGIMIVISGVYKAIN